MMNESFGSRKSGKTQWMLEKCVEAIEEGQPYIRVVGYSFEYANNELKRRLIEMIGLEVKDQGLNYIEVEGTIVEFSGPLSEEKIAGDYRFGNYYDHYMDWDW